MPPSYGERRSRAPRPVARPRCDPLRSTGAVCILVRMAVRTNLLLPEALVREVDKYAGPRGRSRFVAEALEAKLKRERLRVAIKESAGVLSAEDYPYWATSEDVVEWVRARRAEKTTLPPDLDDGAADARDA